MSDAWQFEEGAEEKRLKEQQKQQDQEAEDLRLVLSTATGRRFVWRLLSTCGVYAECFHGEETHFTARALGRRSVGLEVLNWVFTSDGDAYTIMRSEAEKPKQEN